MSQTTKREEELKKEIEELEMKVSSLQQKILTSNCQTSSSKDARKMYGDTTPGDITHQDVTLEYSGYFKHAFRNMPKTLQEDIDKYRIWEMCADIMKNSYEENKEDIIDCMIKKMKEAIEGDHSSIPPTDEDTVDTLRAFAFLLHHISPEELKQKVHDQYPPTDDEERKALDLALDIITLLPPCDHKLLLTNT